MSPIRHLPGMRYHDPVASHLQEASPVFLLLVCSLSLSSVRIHVPAPFALPICVGRILGVLFDYISYIGGMFVQLPCIIYTVNEKHFLLPNHLFEPKI